MLAPIVDFANLLLGALVTGTMFGVWLCFNPAGSSPEVYVMRQQQLIGALNVVLPILGAITVLSTFGAAALAAGDRSRLVLLLVAAGCFMAAGVITRFVNQPMNAVVMTWTVQSVPSDWMQLRDAWWRWHGVRLAAGFVGLSLLIAAALVRGR